MIITIPIPNTEIATHDGNAGLTGRSKLTDSGAFEWRVSG